MYETFQSIFEQIGDTQYQQLLLGLAHIPKGATSDRCDRASDARGQRTMLVSEH